MPEEWKHETSSSNKHQMKVFWLSFSDDDDDDDGGGDGDGDDDVDVNCDYFDDELESEFFYYFRNVQAKWNSSQSVDISTGIMHMFEFVTRKYIFF